MQALPSFECSSEIVSTAYAAGRFILGCGETALIGSDRLLDPAGSVIFQPNAQLSRDERASDIGVPGEVANAAAVM